MTIMERLREIIFGPPRAVPSAPYMKAISDTNDLMDRMRRNQASTDPIRAMMADIWMRRHNVPYIVTMYEANQEMKVQDPK